MTVTFETLNFYVGIYDTFRIKIGRLLLIKKKREKELILRKSIRISTCVVLNR